MVWGRIIGLEGWVLKELFNEPFKVPFKVPLKLPFNCLQFLFLVIIHTQIVSSLDSPEHLRWI